MEYIIQKSDLTNYLLAETLQALSACYRQLQRPLYVVGATARDISLRLLHVDNIPRSTLDLDVAVALQNWSEYDQLTAVLSQNGFEKAPEKQRFYFPFSNKMKYEVDIVPFGSIAEQEHVAWPPDGSPVMSVRCFNEVMGSADLVEVGGDFSFYIASLSGQFLLKLDTWQDRHLITNKDAADMVFILQNVYVAYALSRNIFPPEIDIDAEHFSVMVAGAEWMASDLKTMLSTKHQSYYSNWIFSELEKEENSELLNDMLDVADSRQYGLFHRAFFRMAQILEP